MSAAVALVTGAASGIGRATAERLTSDGWAVVGCDIRDGPGLVACDVTSTASVEAAVARCVAEHRALDAVVNAAGIGFPRRFLEASDDDWQTTLQVNLLGTVRVCRAALPHLRRSTQAVRGIVNFTSQAAKTGGLLIVTFDEAEAGGSTADSSACCNEQPGPNTIDPGGRTPGPGGGRVGAVLVSPFIRPGSVNRTPYNHYSLLASIEDRFGLPHLGYAGQKGLSRFGTDVYNAGI